MKQVVREEWLKLYDKPFVDGLVAGLLHWRPEMCQLAAQLEMEVTGIAGSSGVQVSGRFPGVCPACPVHLQPQALIPCPPERQHSRAPSVHNCVVGMQVAGGAPAGTGTAAQGPGSRQAGTQAQPFNLSLPRPKPLPADPEVGRP